MDQCEDREEGVPPSKTTQRNKPGSEFEFEPGPGPESSCAFFKSNMSLYFPFYYKQSVSSNKPIHQRLKAESEPSCVSLKSNKSNDIVVHFESSEPPAAERVEPAGVRSLTTGLEKYYCRLTFNTNTVNRNLQLSDNRKVTFVEENQSYPDHPDRFDFPQLLCKTGLTGRCYWEVEWSGDVYISVSYRGISRRGCREDCVFGWNDQSWSLDCSDEGYSVWHNNERTPITSSSSFISSSSSVSNRVAVYVDCPAGILSFYSVFSDSLIHLHTFNTTFTQTLYPGFWVWFPGSSVFLC